MKNKELVFNIIKKSSKNLTAYEILDKLQKFKNLKIWIQINWICDKHGQKLKIEFKWRENQILKI